MTQRKLLPFIVTVGFVLVTLTANAQQANPSGPTNPFGSEVFAPMVADDQPVTRGFFLPSAEAVPGGVKIIVDIYHAFVNGGVSLWLQVVLNDGAGTTQAIDLTQLSDKVNDNPKTFRSHREFTFMFAELNNMLHGLSPKIAGLKIGPGTPLFVYGRWDVGHQWGGQYRGGVVFVPADSANDAAATESEAVNITRPDALDIAYQIPQSLTYQFNDSTTGAGLMKGGQVRSRVEGEGKFQVPLHNFANVRRGLFSLAKDPAAAAAVLGSDWTIEVVDRYMKKDADGKLILDAEQLPTPDPMVDTYYDNENFDAAKNDYVLRYRWTEQNQTGSWNIKPGIGTISNEGVVFRIEQGVDTTDDKPGSIAKFADSIHPLNVFSGFRQIAPDSKPSDFLKPAVKITDTRYKFKLKHKNGLIIEVSLDDVSASSLRGGTEKPIHFAQLEMDIDHLATQSMNVSQPGQMTSVGTYSMTNPNVKAAIDALTDKAFIDGNIVMHTKADLDKNSPLFVKHAADFQLSGEVIAKLRQKLLGDKWRSGAQKYALAATDLQLVKSSEASPSVKALIKNGYRAGEISQVRKVLKACAEIIGQQ